ncbi:carboxypeptidase-like regulatory domain-containing protein [uncultured Dokdonia sp.]|uniref:carboxypeptidase-like regulatory domain-containing protein n=1 Tax=uncultured Dokdonia sp. TaxID=575653 RepID=UPI00261966C0|nr:carboxypeptidase-like regulatory domain-containing protein [uncultured Dokdonia sp.]
MKKSIKITIPSPCHEDWAKMTPTQKGKYCAVCEKEVIDFTKATDEQLYKTATSGGNLCGRFTKSQLDRSIQLQRKEGRSWASYAASLLIPVAILSTQEITAQDEIQHLEQTNSGYQSLGISSLTRLKDGTLSRKQTKNDTIKEKKRLIKGTISDTTGPIAFSSIYIKGKKKSVQANLDGTYELEAATGDVVVFMSLGYEDVEVKVKDQNIINVILKGIPLIIVGEIRVVPSGKNPN